MLVSNYYHELLVMAHHDNAASTPINPNNSTLWLFLFNPYSYVFLIYIYIKHIHMTPSHMKYDRLRINILYCSNNILPILQVSNYPRYSGWILLIHSSEHRWNLRPAMISYGDDFPDPIPIISVTSRPDVILPSGKHTKSYWKWPFIVDLPIENGDVS